jgi:hypothetical protein
LGGSSKNGLERLYNKTIRYCISSNIRTKTLKKEMLCKREIYAGVGNTRLEDLLRVSAKNLGK